MAVHQITFYQILLWRNIFPPFEGGGFLSVGGVEGLAASPHLRSLCFVIPVCPCHTTMGDARRGGTTVRQLTLVFTEAVSVSGTLEGFHKALPLPDDGHIAPTDPTMTALLVLVRGACCSGATLALKGLRHT